MQHGFKRVEYEKKDKPVCGFVIQDNQNRKQFEGIHKEAHARYPDAKIIFLARRDKLAQWLSLQEAGRTDIYMALSQEELHATPKRRYNPDYFKQCILEQARQREKVTEIFESHERKFVHYEDLPDIVREVVEFLGVSADEVHYEVDLLKQRQYNDPFDVIENVEEMRQAVKELGYESMA